MASNMVGTPCRAVHFSWMRVGRINCGLNVSPGQTTLAPWVKQASTPKTRPKQWNKGGAQQRISFDVKFMRSPMNRELFTRLLEMSVDVSDKKKWN